MLESITIFSPGGLIYYQYRANPSLLSASDGPTTDTNEALNEFIIRPILCDPAINATKFYHIAGRLTFCWVAYDEFYTVACYPDILFEGPRQYLKEWSTKLVEAVASEYLLYYEASTNKVPRPDPQPFDTTFQLLLQQSKSIGAGGSASTKETTGTQKKTNDTSATSGKAKRNWHDGNAKITQKAMEELDFSGTNSANENPEVWMELALKEARQAYLPSQEELQQQKESVITQADPSSWSTSISGLFQQIAGTKILTDADLEKPLAALQEMLTSQNVAAEIAQKLVDACRVKLVGKKLQSLYRVQTAVQQALEAVVTRFLQQRQVDLLRLVNKSGGSGVFGNKQGRPFVIVVCGINGIGKTTTVAKLAYYFQQHGCYPLLAAADTFRSGAVEQLRVHAECLQVPIFAQGYAKDPSAVAAAAIQQATTNGNRVVLVDTAGRMQNNVSLMKAMTKLIQENQPDFRMLVCEALVGHDGLDQFQLFQKAVGKIDGLILTKMDTVGSKVGAALTLTHQTGTPIVFCGTGQKYHHLQELSVPQTVQSLLSTSY
ncbi:signal recognition particle receptor subunit alpha [Fistulifera solaris]|uniref:Signal recognition particle receptor subunit alpha homolog n=1 Tax=Fistulifera solaris TaxID=1519565 RepID=A0A1Z5KR07_FISSO|nr:signal recognition particle receptor subunit alpha [Fistulifera solaris]|eukprot:GAX28753.1 signal recognition particle receptor subunit alpha [Fistulifera solaris]